jgi:hypothetical protein
MTTRIAATRRALLRVAGAAAGVSVLGGCTAGTPKRTTGSSGAGRTHLVFVTTERGVSVLDQEGRVVTPPTTVAAATPDWSHVVTAQPHGADTRVVVQDLASRQVFAANILRDRLEPRIVSATGGLVASVTPGGAGIYGLHKPGGRERTTVVVSDAGGERARLDLAGNIEPDVFSPSGDLLFVLDYVPAAKPERYRLQAVDLAARRLTPLFTRGGKPVPVGTERQTRAHRIESVYDQRRAMFYTLYAYQPDAIAFVDCLHLGQRWTHRVALPAPFGRERPGVHAIALSPSGDHLCVVHASSGSVVDIDPDRLEVKQVSRFAAVGEKGKPNARITASGRLVINVDNMVVATNPRREIITAGHARGLALGADNDIWVGNPTGVVQYDLATGREIGRITVPGLFTVKHVRTTAG